MKLKKILALLTILLLTLTACKSTEEPVVDEKPLKLSDRVGVYKLTESQIEYIVEVKAVGEIWLANSRSPAVPAKGTPDFLPTATNTVFNITVSVITDKEYKIEFVSGTQLKMSGGELPVDTIKTLTKINNSL